MLREDYELREEVHKKYMQRIESTTWNESELVYTIPAAHGTDFSLAMAICATGFASLSTT
jgi:hypothetical protein